MTSANGLCLSDGRGDRDGGDHRGDSDSLDKRIADGIESDVNQPPPSKILLPIDLILERVPPYLGRMDWNRLSLLNREIHCHCYGDPRNENEGGGGEATATPSPSISVPPWPNNDTVLDVGRYLHHPDLVGDDTPGSFRPHQIEDIAISPVANVGKDDPTKQRPPARRTSRRGQYIACVCHDSLIRVWDCLTGYCLVLPANQRVTQIEFDPTDANRLISGGKHPAYYIFDDIDETFEEETRKIRSGATAATANNSECNVFILSTTYRRRAWEIRQPNDKSNGNGSEGADYQPTLPARFAISGDGKLIAMVVSIPAANNHLHDQQRQQQQYLSRSCIAVCRVDDGSMIRCWRHTKPTRTYLRFCPEPGWGRYLATIDWSDRNIVMWDLRHYPPPENDGRRPPGWDTGRRSVVDEGAASGARGSFSEDAEDAVVFAKPQKILLQAHTNIVVQIVFGRGRGRGPDPLPSPPLRTTIAPVAVEDGRGAGTEPDPPILLASICNNGTVCVWRISTGSGSCEVGTIPVRWGPSGLGDDFGLLDGGRGATVSQAGAELAFSPDGRGLAIARNDEGSVELWNSSTLKPISSVPRPDNFDLRDINNVGSHWAGILFTPSGDTIVVADGRAGCVHLREAPFVTQTAVSRKFVRSAG